MPGIEQAHSHVPAHAADADKTEMLACHGCLGMLIKFAATIGQARAPAPYV
jgi:hypothetical protein